MAEYKGIKGFKVQTVSTDPAASIIATGVWASGGDLNSARYALTGMGTQTAGLVAAGVVPGSDGSALVEKYNGSSWTEVADLNGARRELASAGTDTAAVVFGGGAPAKSLTESWDGIHLGQK
jgi:hypothetical protein